MTQQKSFARRISVRRLVFRQSVLSVALVVGGILLSGIPVAAGDSDLDSSFNGGVVITDQNQVDQINDIVIQPDGKIVAVGRSGFVDGSEQRFDVMVARYNSDGSLDTTFGNGGIVTTLVLFDATAMGVALQDDGKIVVAGTGSVSLSPRLAVLRYNTDGSLDDTFGNGGIVRERIGRSAKAMDLAIQSDGMIVVAGQADMSVPRSEKITSILARFDPFGFLDFTFGDGGVSEPVPPGFTVSPMIIANSVALQADEKIAVAGVCRFGSLLKFCLARHNSDGSLDNTFDGDGLVVTHFDSFSSSGGAEALSLQPDGKIVATGQILSSSFGSIGAVARFNTDGSLDTSFGSNGDGTVLMHEIPQFRVESLALKPNGRIAIAGEFVFSSFSSDMAVAYYNSDGVIEDLALTTIGEHAAANAVSVQADGRIVVGGYGNFTTEFAFLSDFALARYGVNNPPVVSITGPPSGSIFAVNTPVDFSGAFVDEPGDTHTVEWLFESITQPGTVVVPANSSFGIVTTPHSFTEAGIYKVALKVTDNNFLATTATTVDGLDALVVIYDPNGGWVAGGGWFDSPEGAFALSPTLTGKANFGFVSKYQNGASTPTGNVHFQFNTGDLKFHSTSFEWLVISGGRKAQYKGVGTINGSDSYRFMLTAIDGDQPSGGGHDKFRIRIWSDSTGLIYDNQLNAPDSDDPTTVLGGGSIVIHP